MTCFSFQALRPVYRYRLRLVSVTVSVKFTFEIVCMVTVCLTVRMDSIPILSIRWSVSIDIMINLDGDGDGHRDRDGTCEQALRKYECHVLFLQTFHKRGFIFNILNTNEPYSHRKLTIATASQGAELYLGNVHVLNPSVCGFANVIA